MDVDVEHPHHHHKTGHHWLDKVVPIAALFISFLSIGIAYHHGKVMQELVEQNERLVQANSLPHLQIYGSNVLPSGGRGVSYVISNAGIGPAEVRSAQMLVDGRPVRNAAELVRGCCGGGNASGLTTSSLLGQMLRPGQELRYIDIAVTPENAAFAERLDQARKADRVVTNVCYCSVFDECWTRSSRGNERPQNVISCPMPQPQYEE